MVVVRGWVRHVAVMVEGQGMLCPYTYRDNRETDRGQNGLSAGGGRGERVKDENWCSTDRVQGGKEG